MIPTRVWLPRGVLGELTREADDKAPDETGGMLLGYISNERDNPEAVIEAVIPPGPRAKHEPYRFEPDGPWQRGELERIYYESPSATYLGDWHSHPDGGGLPSRRDRRTARAVARRRRARAPNPLTVILYGKPSAWKIECLCLVRREFERVPVRVFDS